jgi:hypothetical protein
MRHRCGVDGSPGRPRYVERGMAPEWQHDFEAFLAYVLATIGPHPGPGWSIDRINNDLGYFSGNIRWVTRHEQNVQGGRLNTTRTKYTPEEWGEVIRRAWETRRAKYTAEEISEQAHRGKRRAS